MITVWKFPLELTQKQFISMPIEPEFLSVQIQKWQICLWAAVNTGLMKVKKTILIHGTGHPVGWYEKHLGTVQQGDLVWHVFLA